VPDKAGRFTGVNARRACSRPARPGLVGNRTFHVDPVAAPAPAGQVPAFDSDLPRIAEFADRAHGACLYLPQLARRRSALCAVRDHRTSAGRAAQPDERSDHSAAPVRQSRARACAAAHALLCRLSGTGRPCRRHRPRKHFVGRCRQRDRSHQRRRAGAAFDDVSHRCRKRRSAAHGMPRRHQSGFGSGDRWNRPEPLPMQRLFAREILQRAAGYAKA